MFDLVLIERVLVQGEHDSKCMMRSGDVLDDAVSARAEFAKLRQAIEGATSVTFGGAGFGCTRVGSVDTRVPSASVYLIKAPLGLVHHRVLLVKCDD